VLIEDKANGPAIISELQKEIGGVVAVNPEGGKIARAQAMAPLWEAGSIELPDPQVFAAPWIEDYLHNICAFPKAAHDDDVDATSQALIYMRTRLGGGIVDFYRQNATGEIHQPDAAQSRFRRAVSREQSSAESALARNVIAAIKQGSPIQCNERQYPEIRAVLAATEKVQTEFVPALLVRDEIDRLDQIFNWQPLPAD
jgi:hypothetical protein